LRQIDRVTFTPEDLQAAVSVILESKRPVIYAGGGVNISRAAGEVSKLAVLLNAPVALSLMGMGAFPHNHRLCTGMIGMHGTAASNKAVQKADLLIALGARFSDRVTSQVEKFARNAKILHIDIDLAEINKNIHSFASICGDLKTVLNLIIDKLPPGIKTEWENEIQEWKAIIPRDYHRKTALHPRFIIQKTAEALEKAAVNEKKSHGIPCKKTIAVTDVGQHQMWTAQFFPFEHPRSFICSGGLGTMGFGMGAALGAKIASPHDNVVLFTGDGCFRMNCSELATLTAYRIPLLIIVFNNRTLGMVRQWQNFFYNGRYSHSDLEGRGPDFIKLALAYDVAAYRVSDEVSFLAALEKCCAILAGGKPALIEALIDKDECVLPMVPGVKPIDEQIM
jgi:acetolactate synthase-1/2/3 large subunit